MNRSDVAWRRPGPSGEMDGCRAHVELRERMKLEFFSIPILNPTAEQQRLNAFLAQHRVINIDRHLVTEHGHAVWALCVTYLDGPTMLDATQDARQQPSRKAPHRERVDYKEVLSPDEFRVFSLLRDVRKTSSQQAGIPLYSVFKNEQLAQMVRERMQTKADLQTIEGVGKARIDKFGDAFIAVLREAWSAQPTRTQG